MKNWQINHGIKPNAKNVSLRFVGNDGLPEQLHGEHPDDWEWDLMQDSGRITMYKVTQTQTDTKLSRVTEIETTN